MYHLLELKNKIVKLLQIRKNIFLKIIKLHLKIISNFVMLVSK
jgi:hypothetical protein